mmetsp:Transcript_12254/g.38689  ORF Transcript_12254/g.38689 Transcript_12254/m.38689 type:complete len:257 (-) Transcript_12254:6-776(-)
MQRRTRPPRMSASRPTFAKSRPTPTRTRRASWPTRPAARRASGPSSRTTRGTWRHRSRSEHNAATPALGAPFFFGERREAESRAQKAHPRLPGANLREPLHPSRLLLGGLEDELARFLEPRLLFGERHARLLVPDEVAPARVALVILLVVALARVGLLHRVRGAVKVGLALAVEGSAVPQFPVERVVDNVVKALRQPREEARLPLAAVGAVHSRRTGWLARQPRTGEAVRVPNVRRDQDPCADSQRGVHLAPGFNF